MNQTQTERLGAPQSSLCLPRRPPAYLAMTPGFPPDAPNHLHWCLHSSPPPRRPQDKHPTAQLGHSMRLSHWGWKCSLPQLSYFHEQHNPEPSAARILWAGAGQAGSKAPPCSAEEPALQRPFCFALTCAEVSF